MNGSILLPLLMTIPGALLVQRLRVDAGPAELAGLGGLTGLGAGLAMVWLAGAAGLPLTAPVVFAALGFAAVILVAAAGRQRRNAAHPAGSGSAAGTQPAAAPDRATRTTRSTPSWTPAEIAILTFLLAIFFVSAWRASFYPISAMDAHSYDGRARWIAEEGTLNISAYRTFGITGSSNLAYPPLMPLGLSLARWTGATQGKIIDAFYFAALLCTVYGLLRRRLPRIGALSAAALTAAIPELWLHASLSLTNLPATAFLTGAFLTAADTLGRTLESNSADTMNRTRQSNRSGRRRDWVLPGLLAACAAAVRPDAIVPAAGAAVLTVLILFINTRRVPDALVAGLLFLAPAVILTALWRLELSGMIPAGGDPVFRSSIVPDPVLVGNTFRAFTALLPNPSLTGWALPVFTLGFTAWIFDRGEPAAQAVYAVHAAITVVTLGLLFGLFQQIDPSFGGGGGSYLQNSLKRALFYALPVAIVSGFLSPPIRKAWERADRFQRSGGKDS